MEFGASPSPAHPRLILVFRLDPKRLAEIEQNSRIAKKKKIRRSVSGAYIEDHDPKVCMHNSTSLEGKNRTNFE